MRLFREKNHGATKKPSSVAFRVQWRVAMFARAAVVSPLMDGRSEDERDKDEGDEDERNEDDPGHSKDHRSRQFGTMDVGSATDSSREYWFG